MKDQLVKALALNDKVRIIACTTTNLVEEARKRHDLWPTSTGCLGQAMSIGAILGSMLKGEHEHATIEIKTDGMIEYIYVDSNCKGEVRGFVGNKEAHLVYNDGRLAIDKAIGNGTLSVIKDLGLKENFKGTVELIGGNLGNNFAYYFAVSEQTNSAISVGIIVEDDNSVSASGAIIIQLLPNADDNTIDEVEKIIKIYSNISTMIKDGNDAKDLILKGFKDAKIISELDLCFKCNCSKERFGAALLTLKKEDLLDMIEKDHGCTTTCHYCNNEYHFTEEDLKNIINQKNN